MPTALSIALLAVIQKSALPTPGQKLKFHGIFSVLPLFWICNLMQSVFKSGFECQGIQLMVLQFGVREPVGPVSVQLARCSAQQKITTYCFFLRVLWYLLRVIISRWPNFFYFNNYQNENTNACLTYSLILVFINKDTFIFIKT